MTDRELLELLELAAKAAGLSVVRKTIAPMTMYSREGLILPPFSDEWNPLEDDGDAFRLAVKLGMSIHADLEYSRTHVKCKGQWFTCPHNNDAEAATRRAIFHAAVEMGRSML